MKLVCLGFLATAVAASPLLEDAPTTRPDIATRVLRITEKRVRDVVESDGFSETPTTTVTLEFQGPELEGVTHWFGLELKTAKDDVGTDLRVERFGQDAGEDTPETIDREHMWFGDDNPPTDRLKLDIDLGPTPRKAKEIARLQGHLMMRRATLETATIDKLPKLVGKKIEHALLEGRGVTIKVADFAEGDDVELKITGDLAAVTNFRVVDKSGEDLEAGSSYWSSGGEKSLTLSESRIDKGCKLLFDVATANEDIKVPFDVKKIELP